MKTWIIEMPDGWIYGECKLCPRGWACNEKNGVDGDCPLANAKEAVKIKSGLDVCWGEKQAYDFHSRKPIAVYAVETKP